MPKGGRAIVLGGDMYGVSLARKLVELGFHVTLVPYERTFWPHPVEAEELPQFLDALAAFGIEVFEGVKPGDGVRIEKVETVEGAGHPKRVAFTDGGVISGDIVLPFFGTLPAVDFMHGAGVEIEHGIHVDDTLRTANEAIWAIGDACQLGPTAGATAYIHYCREDVTAMANVAALNMTGDRAKLGPLHQERLGINERGELVSPYLH